MMLAHSGRQIVLGTMILGAAFLAGTAAAQDGNLQQMRDDVRGVPSASSSAPAAPATPSAPETGSRRKASDDSSSWDDGLDSEATAALGMICLAGLAAPFWTPYTCLGDSFDVPASFPRFPYDHVPGYLVIDSAYQFKGLSDTERQWLDPMPAKFRRWGGRFDVEYAEDFDSLSRLGSHLLVSTTSRFDLDAETHYFHESFGRAGRDHLWLGDCNLTFRFAQSEPIQFRTGVGINWLSDDTDTELGFNFTYGVDLFPSKPWVLSSSIDWGTLGSAELFRFHTTVGVVVHGVEVYTGYEYLDIDRTHTNTLLGGVRIWF